ncbi:30S ribosomal protein S8 [Candidatus Bipolaricaulota bacterium]|nr:30S ribosomal protein S8 [Candidatus Bipolaricaulota bacterium]MCK5584646.1 30S ribosomal protein S8 [Candidatus Bipolaricaulota bacterium]
MIPYPIGDMLTRIRNANSCFHPSVSMPHSKMKEAVARILESEGYIVGFEVVEKEPQPELKIQLKYQGDRADTVCAISTIRLVSKPSRRVYVGKGAVPQPLGGMGTSIISTSQGIISGKDARVRGIGGEVLCEVW